MGVRDFTEANRSALLNGVLYDNIDNHFSSEGEINQFATEVTELVPETAPDFLSIGEFYTNMRTTNDDAIQVVGQLYGEVDEAEQELCRQLNAAKNEAQILLTALQGLNRMINGGTGLHRSPVEFMNMANELAFQVELARALDLVFPYINGERQVCWNTLAEMLGGCHTDITDIQFLAIAEVVVMLNMRGDVDGLERFVIMMMHQVDDIVSVDERGVMGPSFPAWEINQGMLMGVITGLSNLNTIAIDEHSPIWSELRHFLENNPEDFAPPSLMNPHNDFLNRHENILQSLGFMMFLFEVQTNDNFQFIGDINATTPNFSLTKNGSILNLSFSGVQEGHLRLEGGQLDALSVPDGSNYSFNISTGLSGGSSTAYISGLFFNPNSVSSVANEFVMMGFGEVVGAIGGLPASVGLGTLGAFLNLVEENNEASGRHQAFLRDSVAQDFGMSMVVVSNYHGDDIMQQYIFPSHRTVGEMGYRNSDLNNMDNFDFANYDLEGDRITPIDLIRNPDVIQEIWERYLKRGT